MLVAARTSTHDIYSQASYSAFKRHLLCGTILAGLIMLPVGASAATVTLDELGNFGGTQSEAYAITNTGIAVGRAFAVGNIYYPFSWTKGGAMDNLGALGPSGGGARGISSDGTYIVGYADNGGGNTRAYRWALGGGMLELGVLAGGSNSYGMAISADGTVVGGHSEVGAVTHAFRWTQAGGMVDLATLGGSNSYVNGMSADGSVIVGQSNTAGNASQNPFRWTQVGGMVDLGTFGGTFSYAYGVSGDGSVVVGSSYTAGNALLRAYRWTQAGGMVDIGTLGGSMVEARSISSDGSIVVGWSETTGGASESAFRWTQAGGIKDLNILLSDAGVNMTGINLTEAYGISPNGKYIVGKGSFPGNFWEAFVVYYEGATADVTTASQQQEATQNLATHQQAMLAESRSTAGQLLGFSRPVDQTTYTFAGGMFGSAVGYTGGADLWQGRDTSRRRGLWCTGLHEHQARQCDNGCFGRALYV